MFLTHLLWDAVFNFVNHIGETRHFCSTAWLRRQQKESSWHSCSCGYSSDWQLLRQVTRQDSLKHCSSLNVRLNLEYIMEFFNILMASRLTAAHLACVGFFGVYFSLQIYLALYSKFCKLASSLWIKNHLKNNSVIFPSWEILLASGVCSFYWVSRIGFRMALWGEERLERKGAGWFNERKLEP